MSFISAAQTKRRAKSISQGGNRLPMAVILISHNYGRFLQEAVDSVRAQSATPSEVIVIDDASTDDTREVAERNGLRYLRHESRNVYESRKLGASAVASKYLCFLDADDKLAPKYLESAVSLLEADGSLGIAFSDLQEFGSKTGRKNFQTGIEIERHNNYHAGSVVRRAALITSGFFQQDFTSGHYNLDWIMWRAVVRSGWKVIKNPESYLYRRHDASMTAGNTGHSYREYAQLEKENVTIIVPLSGRRESVPRFVFWLNKQTWPRDQCRLLLVDTVAGNRFGQAIAAQLDYPNVRLQSLPIARPGLADDDRARHSREVQEAVATLYAQLRMMTDTEYNLIIEDDVSPPSDAIERLLHGMDHWIAAVIGVGWSRYARWYVAWLRAGNYHLDSLGAGIQEIDGCWFGCTMLRRSAWLAAPITCDGRGGNYDVAFFDWLMDHGWQTRINWDVHCRHGDLLPKDEWRLQDKSQMTAS